MTPPSASSKDPSQPLILLWPMKRTHPEHIYAKSILGSTDSDWNRLDYFNATMLLPQMRCILSLILWSSILFCPTALDGWAHVCLACSPRSEANGPNSNISLVVFQQYFIGGSNYALYVNLLLATLSCLPSSTMVLPHLSRTHHLTPCPCPSQPQPM
jgi:hypothetical protein